MKIFREKLGLTQDELDELLEKAFTAIDGLWFLGLEEAVGFPWWENLKRAGREKLVPCHRVDQEMFTAALRAVDPGLRLEWITSRPEGAQTCQWRIRGEGPQG